jgi:uncharacterized protein YqgC (DUF456 family)
MAEFTALLFILLLLLILGLNILGLPGNWGVIALVGVWRWTHPAMDAGWWFFILLLGLALAGELVEFFSQIWGGKRYGGTRSGNWGAFFGSIIGAVILAPFLLGLGALIGAIAGAYAGSLALELLSGRSMSQAMRAASGAMYGRVLGTVVKLGLGVAILAMAVPRIWPG